MRKGRQQEKWESDGFLIRLEDENCWTNFTGKKKERLRNVCFNLNWTFVLEQTFCIVNDGMCFGNKVVWAHQEILLSILIEINKYHRFSVYQISCLKWTTCILFSFSCLWSTEKLRKVFFPHIILVLKLVSSNAVRYK